MIMDLSKMSEATAQAVREICRKQEGPCVGMCLLFLEFNEKGEREWKLTTHFVGDTHDPLEEEDQTNIRKSMEYVMHNAMLLYEGEDVMPEGGEN